MSLQHMTELDYKKSKTFSKCTTRIKNTVEYIHSPCRTKYEKVAIMKNLSG